MKIYVVHDYDCVVYAGTNKKDATQHVKGNGCVQVWQGGVWQYDLVFQFAQQKWGKRQR